MRVGVARGGATQERTWPWWTFLFIAREDGVMQYNQYTQTLPLYIMD